MARTDPHSYFDDSQPRATRWFLRLLVDFDSRILGGEVTLMFPVPPAAPWTWTPRGWPSTGPGTR